MKRIINIRFPVMMTCALALGVATAFLFVYFNIDIVFISAVVPLTAVFFITLFFLKKRKYSVFALLFGVAFTIGFLNCYFRMLNYSISEIDVQNSLHIVGNVIEKGDTANASYIILNNATADGVNLGGKIKVTLLDGYGQFCDVGYRVEFDAKLTACRLFNYGNLNYYIEDNIKYTCTVYGNLTSSYGFDLFGAIRSAIRNALDGNLDRKLSPICYAMLVGDTQGIDEASLSAFRYGGIAHIFAVSGLHIGIVFGIINKACKKLRLHKYVTAILSVGLALFYCGICGFTLSSIRAVIMCAVSVLANLLTAKRDGLNSVSVSAFIILLFTPLSLFFVGFQLSFCAVYAIFLLSNPIIRLCSRIKIPVRISSKASVAISAQLGTLPILATSFGYISGAGLLLNIVFIPILSVCYIFLFVFAVLTAVLPFMGIILYAVTVPLQAVIMFLLTSGFENAVIPGIGSGWLVALYFVLIISFSDKFNLSAVPRTVVSSVLTVGLALFITLNIFSPMSGYTVVISAYYNSGSVLIKSNQTAILIITENANTSRTQGVLHENYVLTPDCVIMLGSADCAEKYDRNYKCTDVYLSNYYLPLLSQGGINYHYERLFSIDGLQFEFIDGYSLGFVIDGISVAVCAGGDIPVKNCDLLVSDSINYDYESNSVKCEAEKTVYFSLFGYEYNVYEYGNMKFTVSEGRLAFAETPHRH